MAKEREIEGSVGRQPTWTFPTCVVSDRAGESLLSWGLGYGKGGGLGIGWTEAERVGEFGGQAASLDFS